MESLSLIGQYIMTGINLLVVLTVLVAVHELGHYWVARLCGMQVDAFGVMMGGLRKTDLSGRLARRLIPSRIVWFVAMAAVACTLVGSFENLMPLHLIGLAALALGLPIWTATRIGALYGYPLQQSLKFLGYSWLAGVGFLYLSSGFKNLTASQVLTVVLFASMIGLLILYYQPVLHKPEEAEMGDGELEIDGEKVPVRFRPVWSRRAKTGTEFSLLALPLGGFAAIKGMHPKADGSETQIEGGFYSKSPFKRFLVLLAGPAFSIGFGILIYIALFSTLGVPKPVNEPILGAVGTMEDGTPGPAAKAGLEVGDRIVSIDGEPVATFYDMLTRIRERADQPMTVVYRRDGVEATTVVTPILDKKNLIVIGPDLEPTNERREQGKWLAGWTTKRMPMPFGEAVTEAFAMPVKMGAGLLGLIVNPSRAKDEVGSVGTIAQVTYRATEEGFSVVLLLAAGLSISLGFMNLLPVPPLDGGQMVVAFVEMLRGGRRLSIKVQQAVSAVGMMVVLALVVSVLTIDMSRFLGKSGKDQPPPASSEQPPAPETLDN